jgi:AcrR family transcriptional regulator
MRAQRFRTPRNLPFVARTGRRIGTSGSREAILAAARDQFAQDGYDGATVRGIAAAAGVDPALVRHYFGGKEHLFVEALELPIDPARIVAQILGPGTDGLGERLAHFFLETWDREDMPFVALLRSVTTNDRAAAMLRQFISREVLGPIASSLKLPQPELRAALAGSQLIGVAMMRYVLRLEPVASMDRDRLAQLIAPVIQRHLSPG